MSEALTAQYGLGLTEQMSGPATKAANALRTLRETIDKDTAALSALEKAQRRLKAGGEATAAQTTKLAASIKAKREAIAKAQAAYLDLGGNMTAVTKRTAAFKDRMAELQRTAASMPGPLGRLVGMWDRFAALVGGGKIAAALLGVTAAVAGLTALTIKASASLYQYAVAQANARRSELLRLEGASKAWSVLSVYYGRTRMSGEALQAGIDRVSASTSLARDEVTKYGIQLHNMGLRGRAWESALEGMTIKAATQGEAQAQMFAGWAVGASLTGRSVEALTNRVKRDLGGIAKAQMLDANVQAAKLGESFAAMTRAIKIEPLLRAKAALYSLFSQSTASGRALTSLLTRMAQPLIDGMTRAYGLIKRVMQDAIIFELRAEIAYLRLRNTWRSMLPTDIIDRALDKLGDFQDEITAISIAIAVRAVPSLISLGASAASAAASYGLLALRGTTQLIPMLVRGAGAAGAAALRFGILAGEALIAAAPFIVIAVGVYAWIKAWRSLKQLVQEGVDWGLLWKQLKADLLGGQIGQGIIDGIAAVFSAPKRLIEATAGMAGQVVDAFKSKLGIQSPSKVFMRIGAEIPAGVEQGIADGQPDVARKMNELAEPPRVKPLSAVTAPGGAAGGGARAGGTVTIGQLHVHAGDKSNARQLAIEIKRELESVLEGVALQMGAT